MVEYAHLIKECLI